MLCLKENHSVVVCRVLESISSIFFILLLFSVNMALALPSSYNRHNRPLSIRQACSLYNQLLREDSAVSSLDAWEYVAEKLQNSIDDAKQGEDVPRALFTLGQLYEKAWTQRGYLLGLTRAIYSYKRLVEKFPNSSLANDDYIKVARSKLQELSNANLKSKESLNDSDNIGSPTPAVALAAAGLLKSSNLFLTRWHNLNVDKPLEPFCKPQEQDLPLIVIDPGHGGEEFGAIGVDGLLEKNVVLSISKYLETLLRERLHAKVVLTRTEDKDIPLIERSGRANALNADLFISIHANATRSHRARGIETYYLDNTKDQGSLRLAQFENQALEGFDDDLSFMISDLIQTAKQPDSIVLAHYLQDGLVESLSSKYSNIRNLGVKRAPFHVLVGAHMPCVLVEVSFIDHKIEGKRLADPHYQHLIAEGLLNGIKNFFVRQSEKTLLPYVFN